MDRTSVDEIGPLGSTVASVDVDWAGLTESGIPLGALLGFAGKWVVDLLAERGRRGHERKMRLLDTSMQAAVAFLSAAELTTRGAQSRDHALLVLDGNRRPDNEDGYRNAREDLMKVQEKFYDSNEAAERALTTLNLLAPTVGETANAYLAACREAEAHPDNGKDERQRLRRETERILRDELGAKASRWTRIRRMLKRQR